MMDEEKAEGGCLREEQKLKKKRESTAKIWRAPISK
jgi:hypothetical protein